ncbi:flagellar hook-length control protein FliK [Neobacillus sp. YIM B06451]|uniref:flagellar hook-length control protein FliK n=1 Tax=Neobacillus sp. YIM B06451 TaxID=3070994 RepID=UPI00292E0C6A|nr:flagellar hook-length control protein FliK [Neobacillus sp. YIM B06451]
MIQPTMLGNVNKAAPGKGQGTESSTSASFDLLFQMVSGKEEGEQKASGETDGMGVGLNPFLLTSQLTNLTDQESPSTLEPEAQEQAGVNPRLLALRQKEALTPQIGKQWDLSTLQKPTNTIGPNGNSPLMAELQKMLDEKVGHGLDGFQISDDSVITTGMKVGEEKSNIPGGQPKEATHQSGNPLKPELLPVGFQASSGSGREAQITPQDTAVPLTQPDTEAVFKPTEIESAFKPTDTKAVADADTKIPSNESRSAHQLQPVIAGDVPVLRANHFEQDFKQFFQSALQQQSATEGKDGMKPAVSFQRFVDGTEAIIKLSPEHLGDVEVKVKIQDGQVKAEFLATTLQGKDLLETQMHTLRSALEVQGLQVGKIDITFQSSNNFMGAFSQRGDANPRQGNQESRKRGDEKIPAEEKYQDYGIETATHSQINTTA